MQHPLAQEPPLAAVFAPRQRPPVGLWSEGAATAAASALQFASQFGVLLAAVRFLAPAEFGLFALEQAGALLLLALASAGWREFVLGWRGPVAAIEQAMTLALFTGYVAGAIGVAAAAAIAIVLDAPVAAFLALLLSASLLIAPITQALLAVVEREMRGRAAAAVGAAADLVGLGATLGGFLAGWSVIALGAGVLAASLARCIGAVLISRAPLRLIQPSRANRLHFQRARKIRTHRIFEVVASQTALIAVSGYLGLHAAGLYKAAEALVGAIAAVIYEPLRRIAWSVLSTAGQPRAAETSPADGLAKQASVLLPLAIVFASPVLVGLAVVSPALTPLVLGEAWGDAAIVVSVLAAAALISIPGLATEPLVAIAGRPGRITLATVAAGATTIFFLALFARFGLSAAAFAQLGASTVGACLAIWLQNRYVKTPWLSTLVGAAPVYAGLAALVAAVLGARMATEELMLSPVARLSIEIGAGALVYAAIVAFINPSWLRRTLWLD